MRKSTAETRAKRAKACQFQRDYRAIIDPEVMSAFASAKRAREKAVELVFEYDEQPLSAITAVATRDMGTIAKVKSPVT